MEIALDCFTGHWSIPIVTDEDLKKQILHDLGDHWKCHRLPKTILLTSCPLFPAELLRIIQENPDSLLEYMIL